MKNLLVTGAGSGLGRSVVGAAAEGGYNVIALDRAFLSYSDSPRYEIDVTDARAVTDLYGRLHEEYGAFAGLVNCAGISRTGPARQMPTDVFNEVMVVNVTGTFNSVQAAHPYLAPGSAIVNIASVVVRRMLPGRAAYTASKAAVEGLTKALALEWADDGIRVNAVAPSWVLTPLVQGLIEKDEFDQESVLSRIPLGRLCEPEEVVRPVMFLLSEDSSYITGETIYIDGGFSTSF